MHQEWYFGDQLNIVAQLSKCLMPRCSETTQKDIAQIRSHAKSPPFLAHKHCCKLELPFSSGSKYANFHVTRKGK
jgi:hypothetical protein